MYHSYSGCIIRFERRSRSDARRSRKKESKATEAHSCREIFLLLGPSPGGKSWFTLNAHKSIKRFIRARCISLPVAALFFLTGRCVNADPMGDFFKKVGNSISKAFQPRPTPNPSEKKTKRTSRRPGSRTSNVAEGSQSPFEELSPPAQKESLPPTVLRASAVPAAKAKGDMPYGIPVPGRKGMVTSPYLPEGNYIDVSGFVAGSAVKDPYTGKLFLVP